MYIVFVYVFQFLYLFFKIETMKTMIKEKKEEMTKKNSKEDDCINLKEDQRTWTAVDTESPRLGNKIWISPHPLLPH